ncbi:MAG: VWA domain-containing protein [Pirellulaceae bacterium]
MSRRTVLSLAIVLSGALVGLVHAQSRNREVLPQSPAAAPVRPASEAAPPRVQLAILLDNSGSMSGLIEQAKSELWRVVNELTTAKQNGKQPRLQVALFTYGDPPPKQLNELTDDLDRVSESLFAVTISGGSEYCGQVIATATRELAWSENPNDLKLIFIAGNEPFSQGPVDYRAACQEAIAKGIVVNTIHCGNGIPDDWRDGALLADGKAMSIDQNTQVAHIEAPQDAEIARLGTELNKTYIPFGAAGEASRVRQMAQDTNAAQQSAGSSVQRAVSKANAYYRNSAWDLVDAAEEGAVELSTLKKEDLPESLRGMNLQQQRAYVTKQSAERKRLQSQINELNTARKEFVAARRKETAQQAGRKTLDQALAETIRSQAAEKAFTFER